MYFPGFYTEKNVFLMAECPQKYVYNFRNTWPHTHIKSLAMCWTWYRTSRHHGCVRCTVSGRAVCQSDHWRRMLAGPGRWCELTEPEQNPQSVLPHPFTHDHLERSREAYCRDSDSNRVLRCFLPPLGQVMLGYRRCKVLRAKKRLLSPVPFRKDYIF